MARLARLSLPGQLHLVIQRGHNGQPVFADEEDRSAYLTALRAAAALHRLSVLAYALADGAVHLLVIPPTAEALSQTLQAVGRRYVVAYNRRHGRSGTLWDGRFRAALIESEHYLLDAVVYVETRIGGNEPAAWSSRGHHIGQRRDPLITDHPAFWALGNTPFEREMAYSARLERGLPAGIEGRLADASLKGWAFGGPVFLAELARKTDRPLQPRPRGRPRKAAAMR
jgi:putative transposase